MFHLFEISSNYTKIHLQDNDILKNSDSPQPILYNLIGGKIVRAEVTKTYKSKM